MADHTLRRVQVRFLAGPQCWATGQIVVTPQVARGVSGVEAARFLAGCDGVRVSSPPRRPDGSYATGKPEIQARVRNFKHGSDIRGAVNGGLNSMGRPV